MLLGKRVKNTNSSSSIVSIVNKNRIQEFRVQEVMSHIQIHLCCSRRRCYFVAILGPCWRCTLFCSAYVNRQVLCCPVHPGPLVRSHLDCCQISWLHRCLQGYRKQLSTSGVSRSTIRTWFSMQRHLRIAALWHSDHISPPSHCCQTKTSLQTNSRLSCLRVFVVVVVFEKTQMLCLKSESFFWMILLRFTDCCYPALTLTARRAGLYSTLKYF